jgi:hypothetical protein
MWLKTNELAFLQKQPRKRLPVNQLQTVAKKRRRTKLRVQWQVASDKQARSELKVITNQEVFACRVCGLGRSGSQRDKRVAEPEPSEPGG